MTFGIKIPKAKAIKLLNKLPRIGYELFIKRVDNNDLYLSNLSGHYYLRCFSVSDDRLLDYFNIKF